MTAHSRAEDAKITQCSNPDCGAIHGIIHGQSEIYCAICQSELGTGQPGLLLTETSTPAFGYAPKIARLGLTHPGIRAPLEYFSEQVAGQQRHCLVTPYVEPLPANPERHQVFAWGIDLAVALDYLHTCGLTFEGAIRTETFGLTDGKAVFADFNYCHPAEDNHAEARAADIRNLATTLLRLLTGHTDHNQDPALPPATYNLFENALVAPGFSSAAGLAQAIENMLTVIVPAQSVVHKLGRLTDVGILRTLNEDSLFTLQYDQFHESVPHSIGIYVVADGMGGHSAGEVASGIIIQTIAENTIQQLLPAEEPNYCEWIKNAILLANEAVYNQGKKLGSDMGSTIVMAVVVDDTAYIGHVGDSRAYLINSGGISPLTTDHSLVERLVATNQITPEEARYHPQRNVIYRTMGDKLKLDVDTLTQPLKPGDRLLLCSDGLNGMVTNEEIRQIVMEKSTSPQEACELLITAANNAGGDDNITVVVLELA